MLCQSITDGCAKDCCLRQVLKLSLDYDKTDKMRNGNPGKGGIENNVHGSPPPSSDSW